MRGGRTHVLYVIAVRPFTTSPWEDGASLPSERFPMANRDGEGKTKDIRATYYSSSLPVAQTSIASSRLGKAPVVVYITHTSSVIIIITSAFQVIHMTNSGQLLTNRIYHWYPPILPVAVQSVRVRLPSCPAGNSTSTVLVLCTHHGIQSKYTTLTLHNLDSNNQVQYAMPQ